MCSSAPSPNGHSDAWLAFHVCRIRTTEWDYALTWIAHVRTGHNRQKGNTTNHSGGDPDSEGETTSPFYPSTGTPLPCIPRPTLQLATSPTAEAVSSFFIGDFQVICRRYRRQCSHQALRVERPPEWCQIWFIGRSYATQYQTGKSCLSANRNSLGPYSIVYTSV